MLWPPYKLGLHCELQQGPGLGVGCVAQYGCPLQLTALITSLFAKTKLPIDYLIFTYLTGHRESV